MNASEAPLQKDEAYFSEVAFFDELAKDEEVTPLHPRGVPLQKWESYEKPIQNLDMKAPKSLKPMKPNEKKRADKKRSLVKK